jgi:hypothetical protein
MSNKASYEAINYSIRPSKSIERKMLVEGFRLLAPFADVDTYAYVGFGSTFFTDFAMVHRALGIRDLLSIERDTEKKDRFEFNKPYKCIRMSFKTSTEALPVDVKWDKRVIAWMDYDGRLNDSVLADVSFFCDLASSGSVLVITVQANSDRRGKRVKKLRERIDPTKTPSDLTEDALEEWGTASVYYRILTNEIKTALVHRNGGRDTDQRVQFQQLFHFTYADGAKMLTLGGVLYSAAEAASFNKCKFSEKLEFVRAGADAYHLVAPSLTLREVQHLDKQLPSTPAELVSSPSVPAEDLQHYRRLYRYFPRFAESEIG